MDSGLRWKKAAKLTVCVRLSLIFTRFPISSWFLHLRFYYELIQRKGNERLRGFLVFLFATSYMISSYFRKIHEATFSKFAGNFLLKFSNSLQNSFSCTLLYFLLIVLFYGFQLTDFHETVRQEVCVKLDFMTYICTVRGLWRRQEDHMWSCLLLFN